MYVAMNLPYPVRITKIYFDFILTGNPPQTVSPEHDLRVLVLREPRRQVPDDRLLWPAVHRQEMADGSGRHPRHGVRSEGGVQETLRARLL